MSTLLRVRLVQPKRCSEARRIKDNEIEGHRGRQGGVIGVENASEYENKKLVSSKNGSSSPNTDASMPVCVCVCTRTVYCEYTVERHIR